MDQETSLPSKGESDSGSDDGNPGSLSKSDLWKVVAFVAGLYLLSAPDYGHGKSMDPYFETRSNTTQLQAHQVIFGLHNT